MNVVAKSAMCVLLAVTLCGGGGVVGRRAREMPILGSSLWSDFETGFRDVHDTASSNLDRMETAFESMFGGSTDLFGDLGDKTADHSPDSKDREPLEPDTDVQSTDMSSSLFPGGLFNLFEIGTSRQPWWKGPNVCQEREEIDESQHNNDTDSDGEDGGIFGSFQFSSCQQTETKYICTTKIRNNGIRKSFVVKYQCCHGFRRVKGKPGCTEVNLKSMIDTVADIGAKDFVQLVKSSGLEEKLSSSNLTLFAPSDNAVRDFTDSLQEANQVEFYVPPATARRRRSANTEGTSMREIVLGHMTPGFMDLSELVDEQVLYSDNSNSSIRINMYPNRVVTANCARVTSSNNYANTGIVHVVDRVIRPVTKTLAQLIMQDEQFRTLASMVKKADLIESLSGPGHFTLFAPTESAFEKLDPAIRTQIQSGHSCVKNLVKHHLLSHSLCSVAITQRIITKNFGGDILKLERHLDTGKIFISDIQVVVKDIIATNGVLHVLDEVIVPDSARPLSNALSSHNMTTFLSLFKEAGLTESLDAMDNVTLFAPTDAALAEPEAIKMIEKVRENKNKLRDMLLYHTTGPEVQACDFTNNMELKSGLADQSLRVTMYSMLPLFTLLPSRMAVQCARIVSYDKKACGGVIHAVDRLLLPPTTTVLEIVQSNDKYSILRKVIKGTGLEDDLMDNDPVTLLAPTDEAFLKLPEEDLKKLLEDKKLAKRTLKQHILPEAMCCSGVAATSWPFTYNVETLGSKSIQVRRDNDGAVHFGSAKVIECDNMATNGILHSVNRVMVPHNINNGALLQMGNPNVEVFLYGL